MDSHTSPDVQPCLVDRSNLTHTAVCRSLDGCSCHTWEDRQNHIQYTPCQQDRLYWHLQWGKSSRKMKDWILLFVFFACFPDCILWIEDPQVPHLAMHENHIPLTPPPKKKKEKNSKKVSLDVMQSHPLHRTHFRQSLEGMQDSCYTCCSTITAST